jgi:hypothetical protein
MLLICQPRMGVQLQRKRSHHKITFYGRLHVIAYPATLDVPRELAQFAAKCCWLSAAADPSLADPGYPGVGVGIPIPAKQPVGGRELDIYTRARNAIRRTLGCLSERVRAAQRPPLAYPPAHHRQPPQQSRRHRCGPRSCPLIPSTVTSK